MDDIILDFETRSVCDIKKAGADQYGSDLSTDILCLALLHVPSDEILLWFPEDGPLPVQWVGRINSADRILAHNARFDKLIWEYVGVNDYGFPAIPDGKWACTSAMARVNALPASLDDSTRALNTTHRKNHRGGQLIRALSIPIKGTTEFRHVPELLEEMGEYCVDDVEATYELYKRLRPMTEEEHRDWTINEHINDRGVKIDVELAALAIKYAEEEKQEIAELLSELTDGQITKHTQTKKLAEILHERLEGTAAQECLYKYEDNDRKITCDRNARERLLDLPDGELPPEVREIVQLVHDGGKSSVSKFERMVAMADENDDRVRGVFVYAGAAQTKRYASRGLQLHNMSRKCFSAEETEEIKQLMREDKAIPLPVMHTLSKLLRPALMPDDGKVFVVGDWSAIEARVLPWLSNSTGGDKVLDVFRNDEDVYVSTAESMGLDDRQIGKVANLSLGYGGAAGAFNNMAKVYGVVLPEHEVVSIVKRWRRANRWAVEFWRDLERAAKRAVLNAGKVYTAGLLRYVCIGGALYCILPDDSTIQYCDAKYDVESEGVTCLKPSVKPKVDDPEWPRMRLWGGLLAENVTQAVSACLLRHLLRRLASQGNVVAHVHDEVVQECYAHKAKAAAKSLRIEMETAPNWAEGLPLKAVPEIMTRYGK